MPTASIAVADRTAFCRRTFSCRGTFDAGGTGTPGPGRPLARLYRPGSLAHARRYRPGILVDPRSARRAQLQDRRSSRPEESGSLVGSSRTDIPLGASPRSSWWIFSPSISILEVIVVVLLVPTTGDHCARYRSLRIGFECLLRSAFDQRRFRRGAGMNQSFWGSASCDREGSNVYNGFRQTVLVVVD